MNNKIICIIQHIEQEVYNAQKGEKISTFRYLILKHADELILNRITYSNFSSIHPFVYKNEFDKQINYFKYLRKNGFMSTLNCNICQKMVDLSKDTWARVKFIRRSSLPLKINEVTITENLLFELNKYLESCKNRKIELFEAINENVNGNDIEFFVQQSNGQYLFFPIQAKILYKSLKYERIPYKNQTNSLLLYAKRTKGIPLYLLYNHNDKYDLKMNNYGCSIVDANYIKSNHSTVPPTFDDLHIKLIKTQIVASPWYILVCKDILDNSVTSDIIKSIPNQIKAYKEYPLDDIYEWKKVLLNESIFEENKNTDLITEVDEFSPKYRIIINNIESDYINE